MSIIIHELNLPIHYDMTIRITPGGAVYDEDLGGSFATAEQLPPHGRLIDADALMQQIEHDTPLSAVFEKTMRRYLHNAPTIIDAEEGEK